MSSNASLWHTIIYVQGGCMCEWLGGALGAELALYAALCPEDGEAKAKRDGLPLATQLLAARRTTINR